MHLTIVESAPFFAAADLYTLRHLPKHLVEARETESLLTLLTAGPQWMNAKRSRLGSDLSYQQDLLLAIQAIATTESEDQLSDLIRIVTPIVHLNSRSFNYSDKYIQALAWLGNRETALDYARLRPVLSERFESLSGVYDVTTHNGNRDPGLLSELRDNAQLLNGSEARDKAFAYLAMATAAAGDTASSEAYAFSIEESGVRDAALGTLAVHLLRLGDWEAAAVVIDQIRSGGRRALLRSELSATLAHCGLVLDAETIALSLRSPRRRLYALRNLVVAIHRRAGADAARSTVFRIEKEIGAVSTPTRRIQEMQDFCQTLHAVGSTEDMARFYIEAEIEIQKLAVPALKAQLLRRQAHILSAADVKERASESLRQALLCAGAVAETQQQAALLTAIGKTALHCGFRELAEGAFRNAFAIAHEIEDQGWRTFELGQLALAAAAGCTDLAVAAMKDMSVDSKRRETALDIVAILSENNATEYAERLFRYVDDETRAAVIALSPSPMRDEFLRRLACGIAGLGKEEEAMLILDQIAEPLVRVRALFDIASAASVMNAEGVWASIAARSQKCIAEIVETPYRDEALSGIAKSLAQCRNVREAMNVTELISEPASRKRAIVAIVEIVGGYSKTTALGCLQRVSGGSARDEPVDSLVLFKTAVMYLSLGSLQDVFSVVHSIREPDTRSLFMGRLALRAIDIDRFLGLRMIVRFQRSLAMMTDPSGKDSGRGVLIRAFLKLDLKKRAAKWILHAPTPGLPGRISEWTSSLPLVARVLMEYGERRVAMAILVSAASNASQFKQLGEKSRTLMLVSDAFQELGAFEDSEKTLAEAVDAARQCTLPKNVYSVLRVADILERRGRQVESIRLVEEAFNLAVTGSEASMRDALRAVASYCIGKGLHEVGFRALAHLDDVNALLLCLSEMPTMSNPGSERRLQPLKEAIRILSWDRSEWETVLNIISLGSPLSKGAFQG